MTFLRHDWGYQKKKNEYERRIKKLQKIWYGESFHIVKFAPEKHVSTIGTYRVQSVNLMRVTPEKEYESVDYSYERLRG